MNRLSFVLSDQALDPMAPERFARTDLFPATVARFEDGRVLVNDEPIALATVADRGFQVTTSGRVIAYPETFAVLQHLRAAGVEVGVLTDVPYGMDRARVEADLAAAGLDGLITVLLTSVDVGRRKPSSRGFVRLAAELGVGVGDLLYVGNEQKDIDGANTAGARSVLIDRDDRRPTWGAWATVTSLEEVVALLESLGHASGTGPSR